MRNNKLINCLAITLFTCGIQLAGMTTAQATTITYQATDFGGGRWQYDYTVINDDPHILPAIKEIEIYFNYSLYDTLTDESTRLWLVQIFDTSPNPVVHDGFYNAIDTTGPGILPDMTLSGFSVSFNWRGNDAPGSQPFKIFGADRIELTAGDTVAPVPEPASLLLFGTGTLCLARFRRKSTAKIQ